MATKKKTATEPRGLDDLELITIDPASLKVRDQVRQDATPDEQLIDSVRVFGVQQPPTVVRDEEDGHYYVAIGHRRVGAAIAAGLDRIHVIVRSQQAADEAAELERQITENERRKSLTTAELAAGYQKLALFGLRPEDIAAQLAEKPERVKAALKATESEAAKLALVKIPSLDFEQAALIAEFDGDDTAQDELLQLAKTRPQDLKSRAYGIRAAQAAQARVAELRAEAEQLGVTIVGERTYDDSAYFNGGSECDWKAKPLTRLNIRPEDHFDCPGHAAFLNATSNADRAELLYICKAPHTYGHDTTPTPRELTPEEIAAEQQLAAEREAAAKHRQELEANTTARREWIRGFLSGRINQAPGLLDFIVETTLTLARIEDADNYDADPIVLQLLTGETDHAFHASYRKLAEHIDAGKTTSLRALAAYAFGVGESVASSPDSVEYAPRLTVAYFGHLDAWGYELTELDKQTQDAAINAGVQDEDDATEGEDQ